MNADEELEFVCIGVYRRLSAFIGGSRRFQQ